MPGAKPLMLMERLASMNKSVWQMAASLLFIRQRHIALHAGTPRKLLHLMHKGSSGAVDLNAKSTSVAQSESNSRMANVQAAASCNDCALNQISTNKMSSECPVAPSNSPGSETISLWLCKSLRM